MQSIVSNECLTNTKLRKNQIVTPIIQLCTTAVRTAYFCILKLTLIFGILSLFFTLTLCFIDHERHQKGDPVRLSDRKQHDHLHERLGARGHGVCGVQYGGARRERARCHQRNLGGARCRDCRENGCVFTHAFTHEPNTKFTLDSIVITPG